MYCAQKHSDGTVTLPVVASVLAQLDLVAIKEHVAQDSFCEIVDIQVRTDSYLRDVCTQVTEHEHLNLSIFYTCFHLGSSIIKEGESYIFP